MAIPCRDRILASLKADLEAITTGGNSKITVSVVNREKDTDVEVDPSDFPIIQIMPGVERFRNIPFRAIETFMPVKLVCFVLGDDRNDVNRQIGNLRDEIKHAVYANGKRTISGTDYADQSEITDAYQAVPNDPTKGQLSIGCEFRWRESVVRS